MGRGTRGQIGRARWARLVRGGQLQQPRGRPRRERKASRKLPLIKVSVLAPGLLQPLLLAFARKYRGGIFEFRFVAMD